MNLTRRGLLAALLGGAAAAPEIAKQLAAPAAEPHALDGFADHFIQPAWEAIAKHIEANLCTLYFQGGILAAVDGDYNTCTMISLVYNRRESATSWACDLEIDIGDVCCQSFKRQHPTVESLLDPRNNIPRLDAKTQENRLNFLSGFAPLRPEYAVRIAGDSRE